MLTLNDGRNELWQWDTNRKLTVDADCSQVHFSNKVFGRSIDVDVVDGVATIPDILLQTDKDLNVWAFVGTAENGYTKISKAFKVNRRNKPADYVFTPHDQTTLGEIVQRLEELEAMQDPDAIRDAVDDYLDNNPIRINETDPTVPEWAKQPEKPNYTAEEVGALPADTVIPEIPAIPSKLPNPNALSFTGAVNATYDGSAPLTVNIPEGGGGTGGGDEWELLWDKTFTSDDVGTAKWELTLEKPCTEITVIAENLLSNQSMGFHIQVNNQRITPNCSYRTNTDKVNNKQVFCEYKGGIWQCVYQSYDFDSGSFQNVSGYVGKMLEPGKAEKITIAQSAASDYQVYDGRMRVFIR